MSRKLAVGTLVTVKGHRARVTNNRRKVFALGMRTYRVAYVDPPSLLNFRRTTGLGRREMKVGW